MKPVRLMAYRLCWQGVQLLQGEFRGDPALERLDDRAELLDLSDVCRRLLLAEARALDAEVHRDRDIGPRWDFAAHALYIGRDLRGDQTVALQQPFENGATAAADCHQHSIEGRDRAAAGAGLMTVDVGVNHATSFDNREDFASICHKMHPHSLFSPVGLLVTFGTTPKSP